MKKINSKERSEYIAEQMDEDDPVHKVFALGWVVSYIFVILSLANLVFELVVNFHFSFVSIRYAIFFGILTFVFFMIASHGYEEEEE